MLKVIRDVVLLAKEKTEDININMIYELVYHAHDHRKGYILLVIGIAEKTVQIPDDNENKAVEPEGSRIEQIQQQSRRKTIDHPRKVSVDKAYRKGEDKQQIRRCRKERQKRYNAGLDKKGHHQ